MTIDDLDRLHDEEVRSIMQMVKTIGRLPNVNLLSYDRDIVWKDGEKPRSGPKFAEKIIHDPRLSRKPVKIDECSRLAAR